MQKSTQAGIDLLQARNTITAGGDPVYFGTKQENSRIAARTEELSRLKEKHPDAGIHIPRYPPAFTGGEHQVWLKGNPVEAVVKKTLPGVYGQILDEKSLLCSRTMLARPQLYLRPALISEYLRRWELLKEAFHLPTTYQGWVSCCGNDDCLCITQRYIVQSEDNQPDADDVVNFMEAYYFVRVRADKISIPEIHNVTWYRSSDGILITDTHPRNFRKDAETDTLIPIDLMACLVPHGASRIFSQPQNNWAANI